MTKSIFILFPINAKLDENNIKRVKIIERKLKQLGYTEIYNSLYFYLFINKLFNLFAYQRMIALCYMAASYPNIYLVDCDKYTRYDNLILKYVIKKNINVINRGGNMNTKDLIFISGPMTNDENYKQKFINAEKYLKSLGYVNVINPAKIETTLPTGLEHDQYLSIDIAILSKCKHIYVLNGWKDSKGAVEEVAFAGQNEIDIIFQDDEETNVQNV